MKKIVLLLSIITLFMYSCRDQESEVIPEKDPQVEQLENALGIKLEKITDQNQENTLYIPFEDLLAAMENTQDTSLSRESISVPIFLKNPFVLTSGYWITPGTFDVYMTKLQLTYKVPLYLDFLLTVRNDDYSKEFKASTRIDFSKLVLRYGAESETFIGKVFSWGYNPHNRDFDVSIDFHLAFHTTIGRDDYFFYADLRLGVNLDAGGVSGTGGSFPLQVNFTVKF